MCIRIKHHFINIKTYFLFCSVNLLFLCFIYSFHSVRHNSRSFTFWRGKTFTGKSCHRFLRHVFESLLPAHIINNCFFSSFPLQAESDIDFSLYHHQRWVSALLESNMSRKWERLKKCVCLMKCPFGGGVIWLAGAFYEMSCLFSIQYTACLPCIFSIFYASPPKILLCV